MVQFDLVQELPHRGCRECLPGAPRTPEEVVVEWHLEAVKKRRALLPVEAAGGWSRQEQPGEPQRHR